MNREKKISIEVTLPVTPTPIGIRFSRDALLTTGLFGRYFSRYLARLKFALKRKANVLVFRLGAFTNENVLLSTYLLH